MAFETKQDILDKIMSQKKPECPHCNKEMDIWEVPQFAMGDGLGWGTPYLFVCFNDECPSYKRGWKDISDNYAHNASYRCICYPGTNQYEFIPVFSPLGGKGQIIDESVLAEQEKLKEAIKSGFSQLADCYVEKNHEEVLLILLDPIRPARVRLKAAEMIGDIGVLGSIDHLRNNKYGNQLIEQEVEKSIKKIHKKNYTRECPFCAEIIKIKAKICKHCNKDVAGI